MRKMRLVLLLVVPTALWACTSLQAPAPTLVPGTPTSARSAAVDGVPSGVAVCYYIWTSQELPALSQVVQSGIQQVAAGASGSAYAYGEDCVSADGTRTFSPMETDFRVSLPVADLTDEQQLGELIAAAMRIIDGMPKDQLVGPRPGRVDFEFHSTAGDSVRFTVDIDRFHREGASLSGARLFRLFRPAP